MARHLDDTFSALADPTRRAILSRLAHGETSVSDLARPFPMSLPAISRHLKVLEQAGLLERHKRGRVHHCKLRTQPLRQASQWLDRYRAFWEGQLDGLAAYLKAEPAKEQAD